jgi:hypothetical protein
MYDKYLREMTPNSRHVTHLTSGLTSRIGAGRMRTAEHTLLHHGITEDHVIYAPCQIKSGNGQVIY